MFKKFIIKKCDKCGETVRLFGEDKQIKCCDEEMRTLIPNSTDAAVEKHVPTYEVENGKIFVKVNHVMEEDHYIEWVSIVFGEKEVTIFFKKGKEAIANCKYVPGSCIYAYCNKHGLWKKDVE